MKIFVLFFMFWGMHGTTFSQDSVFEPTRYINKDGVEFVVNRRADSGGTSPKSAEQNRKTVLPQTQKKVTAKPALEQAAQVFSQSPSVNQERKAILMQELKSEIAFLEEKRRKSSETEKLAFAVSGASASAGQSELLRSIARHEENIRSIKREYDKLTPG